MLIDLPKNYIAYCVHQPFGKLFPNYFTTSLRLTYIATFYEILKQLSSVLLLCILINFHKALQCTVNKYLHKCTYSKLIGKCL